MTLVHHLDRALQNRVFGGNVLMTQPLDRLFLNPGKSGFEIVGRCRCCIGHETVREIVLDIDQKTAHRRGHTGVWWNDHNRDRKLSGHCRPMQRPCAAKGNQGKIARVMAAADRQQAHSVGHIRIGHIDHRFSGLVNLHSKGLGHGLADRLLCQNSVQCDIAARKTMAKAAQHHIGITVGGHFVAV